MDKLLRRGPNKQTMKKITYTIIAVGMVLLTSCEKELDFDYNTIDPLYVVEANITADGAVAKLSQTLDVTDTLWNKDVSNASVTITGENGTSFVLHHDSAGIYSSKEARGIPGVKYTIHVDINGYVTESTSVMQEEFTVSDNYLYKIVMMSEDVYGVRVDVKDEGTKENYYYTLVTRNGEPYKWMITDNRGQYGKTEIDIGCFIDSDMEDHKEDILEEGDLIDIEVRKVDRKIYDYYWSRAIGLETYSNPLRDYTNNTLGYFSACSIIKLPTITYHKDEVEYLDARNKK